jgi:hypothetical protein
VGSTLALAQTSYYKRLVQLASTIFGMIIVLVGTRVSKGGMHLLERGGEASRRWTDSMTLSSVTSFHPVVMPFKVVRATNNH